jgi:hypothetical protein
MHEFVMNSLWRVIPIARVLLILVSHHDELMSIFRTGRETACGR